MYHQRIIRTLLLSCMLLSVLLSSIPLAPQPILAQAGPSLTVEPATGRADERVRLLGMGGMSYVFGPAQTQPPQDLTIWHALEEQTTSQLEEALANFNPTVTAFDTPEALLDALTAAAANNAGPDLYLGLGSWSDRLAEAGLIAAYCLPGECPACESANPPYWCRYATGDFSAGLNADFNIAGLCASSADCAPCFSANPPRWCLAANMPNIAALDIFQASFARPYNGMVFPYGIPMAWDYLVVTIRPEWFMERELDLPASIADLIDLNENYPDMAIFDPGFIDPLPPPFALDPTPTPLIDFIEPLAGDPSPQPSVMGVVVTRASRLAALQDEFGPLVSLPLKDYQPQPSVLGVYVNPQSTQRDRALEAATLLASAETQRVLHNTSGALPTHGAAWATVANAELIRIGRQSLLDFLNLSIDIDPRDFLERLPQTLPDLGSDACGVAALALYRDMTDRPGVTDADRLHAEFASRQFARFCRLYMPEFAGDPACVAEAERVFAETLAANRGVTNAAGIAAAAAAAACDGTRERLMVNFATGAPGSVFVFTALDLPAKVQAQVALRRPNAETFTNLASLTVPEDGTLVFVFAPPANATPDPYTIRVTHGAGPAQETALEQTVTIDADAPLRTERPVDANVPVVQAGQRIYLPYIIR